MTKRTKKVKVDKFKVSIIIILSIFLISILFALSLKGFNISGGSNIAVIKVDGVITVDSIGSLFGKAASSSEDIIPLIKKADKDSSIKGILIDINSPGGSAVASDEIASAVKKTSKPTIALIREVGASGGYWVASSADTVIANRMSITGSIGVISSYLEFSQMMDRYGVSYERLVAGKYKDMGTPFRKLSGEEKKLLTNKLDKIHQYFKDAIKENRNLSEEEIDSIATGEFFLGSEAKELNLIDALGDRSKAEELFEEELNTTKINFITYQKKRSIMDILSKVMTEGFFYLGEGLGSSIKISDSGIRV